MDSWERSVRNKCAKMASGVRAQERGGEYGQSQPLLPWCGIPGRPCRPGSWAGGADCLGLVPLQPYTSGSRMREQASWEQALGRGCEGSLGHKLTLGLASRLGAMQCFFLLRRSPELTQQDVSFPASPSP